MPPVIPLVSLIIVNRNGKRWLGSLIESINAQDYSPTEVILVDNSSIDGSAEYVRSAWPGIKVMTARRNLGFGSAANLGARRARGDFLIFLNEDMKLASGMISRLVACFYQEPGDVGIIAAREVSYDDSAVTQSRGCMLDRRGLTVPNLDKDRAVGGCFFYAPGAPCFITRDCFESVGGFEGYYFLYFEDVDLSWRARLMGYRIAYCEDALIHHAGGGTTNRRSSLTAVLTERNKLLTMLKNLEGRNVLQLFIPILIYCFVASALNAACLRTWEPLRNTAAAVADLARLLPQVLVRRRHLQRRRRVADSAVLSLLGTMPVGYSIPEITGRLIRGIMGRLRRSGFKTYETRNSVR